METLMKTILLFVACILATTKAETYTIDPWEKPSDGQPYDSFSVLVGDTINFIYGTAGTLQDVWIHGTNTCDRDPNDRRVKGNNGPGTITFAPGDGSDIGEKFFFACNTAGSCEAGQYVQVTVYNTEADRQAYANVNPNFSDNPPPSIPDANSPVSSPTTDGNSPVSSPTTDGGTTPTSTDGGWGATSQWKDAQLAFTALGVIGLLV